MSFPSRIVSYPIPPQDCSPPSYCDGPEYEEITQTTRWSTRWCAWVAPSGVRYGKVSAGDTNTDTGGTLTALFTAGAQPLHLTLSFDQDSRPVMARQKDATTIEVIKFVTGVPTSFEFPGRTPLLIYDGVFVQNTSLCDVVCFYIKAAGDAIYARLQRNDFDTEYTLNSDLKTTLQQLTKVDRLHALGQEWLAIYATDTLHRRCVYTSEAYQPWSQNTETKDKLSLTIEELIYDAIIIMAAVQDASDQSVDMEEIVYSDTIIRVWHNESGTLSVAVAELVYSVTVVLHGTPLAEKGQLAVTPEEMLYVIIVITTTPPSEKATQSVGIEEIIYS